LLQKHRDKLSAWQPASPELRKLQALVEWRRTLIEEMGRTPNRLVDGLKGYFPQAVDCFEHRDTIVFLLNCPMLRSFRLSLMLGQILRRDCYWHLEKIALAIRAHRTCCSMQALRL
jgi:hypothetical protein